MIEPYWPFISTETGGNLVLIINAFETRIQYQVRSPYEVGPPNESLRSDDL